MATAPITPAFIESLKSLYPEATVIQPGHSANPWYIVAGVAFSASNRPDGLQRVFERALEDLRTQAANRPADIRLSEQLLLARKMREAILKSGLISGYPKAINGLRALYEVTPEELRDKEVLRDTNLSLAAYEEKGTKTFEAIYGDRASSVKGILDAAYPDLSWFSIAIGYGVVYGGIDTLTTLEISYTLIAALIAGDTPEQISWHLEGARRGGASLDEVRAVRQVAMEVAKFAGVVWKHEVPDANQ